MAKIPAKSVFITCASKGPTLDMSEPIFQLRTKANLVQRLPQALCRLILLKMATLLEPRMLIIPRPQVAILQLPLMTTAQPTFNIKVHQGNSTSQNLILSRTVPYQ
ncbi:MAG: hypothetical protein C0422_04675 [Alcaligenaceae bacterium]|nr:hypothetical protein [Alcaligenaceae bacterium]